MVYLTVVKTITVLVVFVYFVSIKRVKITRLFSIKKTKTKMVPKKL